jgi:electron-transferring-flavoprotein dehydrogenase
MFSTEAIERESLEYDVLIVGAGPAGLSTAIKLKQLCLENDTDMEVCVIEKGSHVGAHILSGNVFEPRALNELFPNWKEMGAPLETQVTDDKMFFF